MTTVSRVASSETAARMMVLALEASLPKAIRTPPVTWRLVGTDRSQLRSEDVVGILADMRKPVMCIVASSQNPVDLSCEPVKAADEIDGESSVSTPSSRIVDGIREHYKIPHSEEAISFRNRYTGASILVSLNDLTEWIRDYRLRSGAIVVREPDESERLKGVVVVVELASSESIRGEIRYEQ